jgi:hypothetical protein
MPQTVRGNGYRRAVELYLASAQGSNVANDVAQRLLELEPGLLGIAAEPDVMDIHIVRELIETLSENDQHSVPKTGHS